MTTSKLNPESIALTVPAAGPIFVTTSFLFEWGNVPSFTAPGGLGSLAILVPIILLSAAFGSVLAIIPCLLGAYLLALLGRGNEAMRMPVMWMMTGGGLAAVPALLIAGSNVTAAAPLIATGAICALICRRGVTWEDDAPLSEPRETAICTCHDT